MFWFLLWEKCFRKNYDQKRKDLVLVGRTKKNKESPSETSSIILFFFSLIFFLLKFVPPSFSSTLLNLWFMPLPWKSVVWQKDYSLHVLKTSYLSLRKTNRLVKIVTSVSFYIQIVILLSEGFSASFFFFSYVKLFGCYSWKFTDIIIAQLIISDRANIYLFR